MPPRWLPDWQNKAQYPNPAQAFPVDWAWEFLRRNPDYQRLWSQLIKPSYKRAHVKFSWRHVAPPAQLVSNRIRPFLHSTAGNYPLAIFRAQFGIVTVPPNPSEPKPKLRTFSLGQGFNCCSATRRLACVLKVRWFMRTITLSAHLIATAQSVMQLFLSLGRWKLLRRPLKRRARHLTLRYKSSVSKHWHQLECYHSCQRRERATSIKGAGMSGTTFWRGLTVSAKDAGHLHPSCAPMARRTLSRTICGALVMVAPTTLHM